MDNVEKIKMMKIIDIKNRREFYKISGMFLLGLAVYGTIIAGGMILIGFSSVAYYTSPIYLRIMSNYMLEKE